MLKLYFAVLSNNLFCDTCYFGMELPGTSEAFTKKGILPAETSTCFFHFVYICMDILYSCSKSDFKIEIVMYTFIQAFKCKYFFLFRILM
jgi:hypothetical protein